MRHIFLLLLVLFGVTGVMAQGGPHVGAFDASGKITGKVIDSLSKQPVDYATISVFKQGAPSPFNGGSSDPTGNFAISGIPAGDYKVTVEFLGYNRKTFAHVIVGGDSKSVSLGTIL